MNIYKILYRICRVYWKIAKPITVGVRIMLIKDEKILLVKHTYQNSWYLPGGRVKKGERLDQAIIREVSEELGSELGCFKLFGTYSNFFEHKNDHIVLFFSNDYTISGETDSEVEQYQLFDLDNLPSDISPGTKRRIEEYINDTFGICGEW